MSETQDPRAVLSLTGPDRVEFLQDLVSNDITKGPITYAALLTPQGKYLSDFFVIPEPERLLIDVSADQAAGLAQRLGMYRLRRKVEIEPTDLVVSRGTGAAPEGALPDPRHPELGWRRIGTEALSDGTDWNALRIRLMVPQAGVELIPNDSYILEMGFERLNGVDFKKGCYVGQEVTARMKHKTDLKKGLATVQIDGTAPVGTEITAGERTVGTLYTQADGQALAWLRFDRASGEMQAGESKVQLIRPGT
ncbi:YgfZ/GcvT domain-containing protein [Palleronia caenipelagi]|uniref:Folate-binding protein YgfZ n=1 Tax=Palleronia caenipelagi TaxID=2489174 RepID=A0A547PXY0_9RHOB|nr:folate-binding protein YgfZ [Palleronia caenipelagi]TRD19017.1 folate-binding protein YgfZ [Palleronia caenipelagi]